MICGDGADTGATDDAITNSGWINPVLIGTDIGPSNQATAMPSTSTFQAGLLRPPMISVLAGRCVPNTAARPVRTEAISLNAGDSGAVTRLCEEA